MRGLVPNFSSYTRGRCDVEHCNRLIIPQSAFSIAPTADLAFRFIAMDPVRPSHIPISIHLSYLSRPVALATIDALAHRSHVFHVFVNGRLGCSGCRRGRATITAGPRTTGSPYGYGRGVGPRRHGSTCNQMPNLVKARDLRRDPSGSGGRCCLGRLLET